MRPESAASAVSVVSVGVAVGVIAGIAGYFLGGLVGYETAGSVAGFCVGDIAAMKVHLALRERETPSVIRHRIARAGGRRDVAK